MSVIIQQKEDSYNTFLSNMFTPQTEFPFLYNYTLASAPPSSLMVVPNHYLKRNLKTNLQHNLLDDFTPGKAMAIFNVFTASVMSPCFFRMRARIRWYNGWSRTYK